MALPTAQEVAAKWAARAGAASQDYIQGAQRTDKDPTQLAIAAGPRYIQRVQEQYANGAWANGLRRAGKAGWLDGIVNGGGAKYSAGVSSSQAKVEQAFTSLLAFQANILSRLATMPANTNAERDARMLFQVNEMRKYQKPGS